MGRQQEQREREPWAALAANADDVESMLVYADLLTERGDPRGELIVLHHRLETSPEDEAAAERAARLLERHARALLGPLVGLREVQLDWRLGFVSHARISRDRWHDFDPCPALSTLFSAEAARFLGSVTVFAPEGHFSVVRELVGAEAPSTLREVRLARRYDSLAEALDQPEDVLWLSGWLEDQRGEHGIEDLLRLSNLERLELRSTRLRDAAPLAKLSRLRELSLAYCPELQRFPEELVALPQLHSVIFDAEEQGEVLAPLFRGFVRRRLSSRRRRLELALALGELARARELAEEHDLIGALDSNVGQVRQRAGELLRERLAGGAVLRERPIAAGSRIALIGSPSFDRSWARAALARRGAHLGMRVGKKSTHAVLCERPGRGARRALQRQEVAPALVLEREFIAELGSSRVAPSSPEELAKALRSRDELRLGAALSTLGEGWAEAHLAELLVLWHDDLLAAPLRRRAKGLFGLFAPAPLREAVKRNFRRGMLAAGEGKLAARLAAVEASSAALTAMDVARLLVQRRRRGVKFLFSRGDGPTIRGALSQLRQDDALDLAGLELEDLPAELCDHVDLRHLDLNRNRLVAFPELLCELSALETLFLESNGLDALPAQLSRLERLRRLELGNNRFSVFPDVLTRLAGLERLGLDHCRLPAEIPSRIARLSRLRRLSVSYTPWKETAQMVRLRLLLPDCQVEQG